MVGGDRREDLRPPVGHRRGRALISGTPLAAAHSQKFAGGLLITALPGQVPSRTSRSISSVAVSSSQPAAFPLDHPLCRNTNDRRRSRAPCIQQDPDATVKVDEPTYHNTRGLWMTSCERAGTCLSRREASASLQTSTRVPRSDSPTPPRSSASRRHHPQGDQGRPTAGLHARGDRRTLAPARRGREGLAQCASAKLAEINQHIAQLTANRQALAAAIEAGCDDLTACAAQPECPLPFPGHP